MEIQQIGYRDEDIVKAGYLVPESEGERRELLADINTRTLAAEKQVAEAVRNAAVAKKRTLELLLAETDIRSPIDGIVGSRYQEIGEKAVPDAQLYTIFNIEDVYVQLEVSEQDLSNLQPGQPAIIYAEHGVVEEYRGSVKLISPYINPDTRSARVRILVPNPEQHLKPGMFVRVTIITGHAREVILVDSSSVLEADSAAPYVLIVRGNRLFKQSVVLGDRYEERIHIVSGLQLGDRVVSRPSSTFRDGLEVEVLK